MSNAQQQRERRARKAGAQGRTVRGYRRRGSDEERRQAKLLQKRDARVRAAEKEGRTLQPRIQASDVMAAHVTAFHAWQKQLSVLCDAHVRRYQYLDRKRKRWHRSKYAIETKQARQRRRAKERHELHDRYIVGLMTGGNRTDPETLGLPLELVEVKRAHLRLKRLIVQLQENSQ